MRDKNKSYGGFNPGSKIKVVKYAKRTEVSFGWKILFGGPENKIGKEQGHTRDGQIT